MESLLGGPIPPLRRDLEVGSVVHEGRPMLVLGDLLGLEQEQVVVSPPVVMVASLFDGQRRAKDVQAELAKQKVILSEAEVQGVADGMEKHGLLETPASADRRRRALESFRQSPVRRSLALQRGWPESPLELGAFLGKFYQDPKGPGQPPAGLPSGEAPWGLVAPHIDFFRGGPPYAWSYGELAKRRPPDVIVALGVAHVSPPSPWAMTRKSYETPLGPLEVDASLYDEIRSALWYDPLDDEWTHAKEHSLEFQAAWLKHIWRSETPKWVPILCSAYEPYCADKPPSSVETVEKAVEAVGRALRERVRKGQRVMILAGIDLAHVGRRFGDEFDITPEMERKVEGLDRASLESALRMEADPFFMAGVGEGAWRKVCGLSAFYTALRWVRAVSDGKAAGRLLAYGQAPDPAGGIVSFASAVYD